MSVIGSCHARKSDLRSKQADKLVVTTEVDCRQYKPAVMDCGLTHLGPEDMSASFHMTFSNAFS